LLVVLFIYFIGVLTSNRKKRNKSVANDSAPAATATQSNPLSEGVDGFTTTTGFTFICLFVLLSFALLYFALLCFCLFVCLFVRFCFFTRFVLIMFDCFLI
jgi:hypothetical protein